MALFLQPSSRRQAASQRDAHTDIPHIHTHTHTHIHRHTQDLIPLLPRPFKADNKLSRANYHKQRLHSSPFVWESSFYKYFREQSINQDKTQVYLTLIAKIQCGVLGLWSLLCHCIPDADSTGGPPKTLSILYWLKMYKVSDKELPSAANPSCVLTDWLRSVSRTLSCLWPASLHTSLISEKYCEGKDSGFQTEHFQSFFFTWIRCSKALFSDSEQGHGWRKCLVAG